MPRSGRMCPDLGRRPSPLQRDWVRPARSHRVGSAEINVMGPYEDVWRRLPLAGAVVTWLVTGSWEEGDRAGRANLARFRVDRCLGIAALQLKARKFRIAEGWSWGGRWWWRPLRGGSGQSGGRLNRTDTEPCWVTGGTGHHAARPGRRVPAGCRLGGRRGRAWRRSARCSIPQPSRSGW
jgi:hypothetical protein